MKNKILDRIYDIKNEYKMDHPCSCRKYLTLCKKIRLRFYINELMREEGKSNGINW